MEVIEEEEVEEEEEKEEMEEMTEEKETTGAAQTSSGFQLQVESHVHKLLLCLAIPLA